MYIKVTWNLYFIYWCKTIRVYIHLFITLTFAHFASPPSH